MMHVFQQKPDISCRAMRAARILLFISILLCSIPFSSHAGLPTPPMTIEKILPAVVHPGDSVEIFLNADISDYKDIVVGFDNLFGEILARGPDALKVRVPMDLRPEIGVWIVVKTPKFETPPVRITVLPLEVPLEGQAPPSMIEIILGNPLYIVSIISLIGIIVFFLLRARSRKRAMQREIEELRSAVEEEQKVVSSVTAPAEAEPKLEPPQVPDELVAACQKGECIVFAGADLSKQAGIPTWQEFVQGLLQWAMDKKILDPNLGSSYSGALQKGQADLVADGVGSAVQTSEDSKDMLLKYLQDMFVSPSAQPTRAHSFLKQIGFAGALTTNLDSLLENSLEAPVFTPQDAEKLLPKLAEREPFVLKLFGTLERPETVQISPAQYRDKVADNRVFLEFVEKLFLSRTLLFLGTSLDGVQSNLEVLGLRNVRRSHYALAGVSGSEWRAKAESLQRRFSVQILAHPSSDEGAALVNFLSALATKVAGERGTAKAVPQEPPRLKRVQLENIGPFETLDVQLDPNWNILLGDNGVGKSNILKAIALALAGKHAQHYADRLIKFGRPSGRIVIELTDGKTNVTELSRTSTEPEIKVLSQRELLGTERWLAIGFPPLRQVGWTLPKGPQPKPGTPYTTPSDVLPLVTGDLDPRMTDLKQSLLNFDSQSRVEGGERYQRLLEDFFDAIGQVTKGVTLRRGPIDRQTWQIFVETDDGKVPLAAVSQGTQSLMGWIGLLLERLYEVYDNTDRPREGPALVLIDEIDAHMHPMWQQTIVHNLTKLFPSVQFIATTHSPLIVGGMDVKQIIRFARDSNGRVRRLEVEQDMTMGRADQLLTSRLFGLPSTLDKVTQDKISKIQEVAVKAVRTAEEDKMLQGLRHELTLRIPVAPEMPPERRAYELVDALLSQHVMELLPTIEKAELEGAKQKLLVKARQLLNEVQNQQRVNR